MITYIFIKIIWVKQIAMHSTAGWNIAIDIT